MRPVQPVRQRILLRLFQAADVAVMGLALVAAVGFRGSPPGFDFDRMAHLRVGLPALLELCAFALCWHAIFRFGGLYRSRRIEPITPEWWDVAKLVALGTLVLGAGGLIVRAEAVDRLFLGAFFVFCLLGTQLMRMALRVFLIGVRRHGYNLRHVVIVGSGPRGARLGRELRDRPDLGYELEGYVDDIPAPPGVPGGESEALLGSLSEVEAVLQRNRVDEVFVALPIRSCYEEAARAVAACETLGIPVRIPGDLFRLRLASAHVDHLGTMPMLSLQTPSPSGLRLLAKRVIDLAGSAVALILVTPWLALIALAIRIDSPGPFLFRQERVGLSGRRFCIFKFRTMVVDAEARLDDLEAANEVRGAAFKMRNDPRITRIGRLLRKLSLDELPQLWNVFRGDLSLVGPRPLPVRDVTRMDEAWQKRRFSVKPGLTGLWQVSGRHEVSFEEWMELDLRYIDNWSLKLDLQILLRTIPAVLRGTGAS